MGITLIGAMDVITKEKTQLSRKGDITTNHIQI
jgi:hypothetical protein